MPMPATSPDFVAEKFPQGRAPDYGPPDYGPDEISARDHANAGGARPLAMPMTGATRALVGNLIADLAKSASLLPIHVFRATWAYRQTIKGPVPERFRCVVDDLRARELETADRILKGRWQIGQTGFVAPLAEIFASRLPAASADDARVIEDYLHGFSWLHHLAAAGPGAAEAARGAISAWLSRYRSISGRAWAPHVTARRLLSFFSAHRFLLNGADILWRSPFHIAAVEQSRYLARAANEAPPGLPALTAAIAVASSGVVFADAARLRRGLERVAGEIARQILPDGGHVSRSPETLTEALADLMALAIALRDQNQVVPDALQNAIDRMAPMVRFFMQPDGRLAAFNGGGEGSEKLIAAVLRRDDARGKPFGHAPYSRFQRLTAARLSIIADMGGPPAFPYAAAAHAGALSLEVASGPHRIFGNCGAASAKGAPGGAPTDAHWRRAVRETAAHATLTIDGVSSLALLGTGAIGTLAARRFGAQAIASGEVTSRRDESAGGTWVDAQSTLYANAFGLVHGRRLFLAPAGDDLRGEDRLERAPNAKPLSRNRKRPHHRFAMRFHLHPDVRASLSQSKDSVLLILANGEGWRFRTSGAELSLAPSVYLSSGMIRKTWQIVLSGEVDPHLFDPPRVDPDRVDPDRVDPDRVDPDEETPQIIKWVLKLEAEKQRN